MTPARRQAGRSVPEDRKVREGITMLESCLRPDLVVESTRHPVCRYGVDAVIFYSDVVQHCIAKYVQAKLAHVPA